MQINEHWAEQLKLHKESEKAHAQMQDGAPHHYARARAGDNKGVAPSPVPEPETRDEEARDSTKDLGRMSQPNAKRQEWFNLDLSGQGLKVISEPLFKYQFLKQLYLTSNKLTRVPPSIRHLRQLTHLDLSNNLLVDLPPELGMCSFLETLLVFDNRIQTLPNEIGQLFLLEMLGIEGNPLDEELKQEIQERGTKSLVALLQNRTPSK